MRRADVISRLKASEPVLRDLGVAALYLFGSHARDEATDGSDVDVFVDPASERDFRFRHYMAAWRTIQESVEATVDYGTRAGLHPMLRHDIEREAIRVF